MNANLRESLKRLRLTGLGTSLDVRLQEAAASRLSHVEFLELILQDELTVRHDRLIARRTKAAAFRDNKSLDDFDWQFNTSIKQKQIFDLATGAFVRKCRDAILVGPPGVGKSHIVQSIGREMIRAGYTVFYRSIFDCVRDFLHDEAFEGHDQIKLRIELEKSGRPLCAKHPQGDFRRTTRSLVLTLQIISPLAITVWNH